MELDLLKRLVPRQWRPVLRSAYTRLRHAGLRYQCNVCGAALRGFLAHGIPPEPDFLCPVCRSKPPHRLAMIFFDTHAEIYRRNALLVHIAPEPGLGRRLAEQAKRFNMRYRAGSIGGTGESYLDLLRLPFVDNTVHLVYCCHVLNCLQEDRAAMSEVFRVLHPDGLAVLQVPAFHRGATTLETNGEAERMATFGDDGIYRCYTNDDYEARLRAAGFEVTAFRASDLPAEAVRRHQLKREVLHLCRKAHGANP